MRRLFLSYFAGFFAFGLAAWIRRTFGAPSIDQIVYHLVYAEGAALQMGEIFVLTFVAEALVFPLLFAAAAAWLHRGLARRWPGGPARAMRGVPMLAVAAGVAAVLLQFSAFSYAAAWFGPDRFAERYVHAGELALREPGKRRNLVVIYVESLEDAYGDPALFGRDLLAPLKAVGGRPLGALHPAAGTTWTIAGMVATQCGVPLKVYSENDMRHHEGRRTFLPGATCLGDLLQAHGWRNVFLGGAPLSFAGKGAYLRDHGYARAYGREEWEREGVRPEELNAWGLYDSALLARARLELQRLHAAGQPFHLTLLTLDTHNPHGFMSPECRRRGARDFAGIVGCSSAQVAEFIEFARAQGYLEDTVFVVLGDHLAVPNPVYDRLQQSRERLVFNLVVGGGLPASTRQALLPFDLYPTLAELAGLHVPDGRLGLGVSAFAPAGVQPRPLPPAALTGSRLYEALWNPALERAQP